MATQLRAMWRGGAAARPLGMPGTAKSRVLPIIAFLLELAGIAAQLVLLTLINDYARTAGCGESCAYAGMGLVAMMFAARWVVFAGTVAALWLALRAWRGDAAGTRATGAFAFHGVVALLPLILVLRLFTADGTSRERQTAERAQARQRAADAAAPAGPPTARDETTAGYAWASDNGVTAASQCTEGSARFVAGCTRYVEQHGGALDH